MFEGFDPPIMFDRTISGVVTNILAIDHSPLRDFYLSVSHSGVRGTFQLQALSICVCLTPGTSSLSNLFKAIALFYSARPRPYRATTRCTPFPYCTDMRVFLIAGVI